MPLLRCEELPSFQVFDPEFGPFLWNLRKIGGRKSKPEDGASELRYFPVILIDLEQTGPPASVCTFLPSILDKNAAAILRKGVHTEVAIELPLQHSPEPRS
jgi:hypothetical protein